MIAGHHHHHLVLKRPFLPCSARVRCFSRYEFSPHIPEHHPFRVQTRLLHILLSLYTLPLSCPYLHISPSPPPTFLQADTQSSPLLRSTCPNHLNLPCLTTSTTLPNPQKTVPTNPHYIPYPSVTHHTSISPSSVPSSPNFADLLSSSPRFQSHMSIHWTKALNIRPFMQYDAPRAVRIGDNSLNLAQAHLTLALAASSTPPPIPSVSPK